MVNFLKYKINTSDRVVILYMLDYRSKTHGVIFSDQKINTSDPCGYFFESPYCKGEYRAVIFSSQKINTSNSCGYFFESAIIEE